MMQEYTIDMDEIRKPFQRRVGKNGVVQARLGKKNAGWTLL